MKLKTELEELKKINEDLNKQLSEKMIEYSKLEEEIVTLMCFLDGKLDLQFKSFQSAVKGSKLLDEILSKQRLVSSNSGLGAGSIKQVQLAKAKDRFMKSKKMSMQIIIKGRKLKLNLRVTLSKELSTLSLQPNRLNFSKGDFHQLPIRLSHREGIILFLMAIVSSAIIMAIR